MDKPLPETDQKKFYRMSLEERRAYLAKQSVLSAEGIAALAGTSGLSVEQADHMIENVVGVFSLPLGLAQNFLINGREVLVPMAVEEPSVVAGASFMARLARPGGGFTAQADEPEMIGQMQILGLPDVAAGRMKILEHRRELMETATQCDPTLEKLGGGARDLEVRILHHPAIGDFLVVHLVHDVRDAMGANTVNTAMERLAPRVEEITGGRVLLRILSNLADHRLARARCTIPLSELAFDPYSPQQVRDNIIAAWAFAAADPYRAATHNKGIMNGVDAVLIAAGNDWRAVEAGAHAYAARGGRYTSLSTWSKDEKGNLTGVLEMPMAVGIVGGATRVHPAARAALNLMEITTARQLAEIVVSVGLAQNLAALRALATEGIQRGHMSLHARQVAITAGAFGDQVEKLADQLARENNVRLERAEEILRDWKKL